MHQHRKARVPDTLGTEVDFFVRCFDVLNYRVSVLAYKNTQLVHVFAALFF